MTAQQDNPYLTITLTNRPPVKIKKDDWPILAEAGDSEYDGQVRCQANRESNWKLKVREHADGRKIVYGIYSYDTHWQNERSVSVRGGELLDKDANIVAAIKRVGQWMQDAIPDECSDDRTRFNELVNDCIADLPAMEI